MCNCFNFHGKNLTVLGDKENNWEKTAMLKAMLRERRGFQDLQVNTVIRSFTNTEKTWGEDQIEGKHWSEYWHNLIGYKHLFWDRVQSPGSTQRSIKPTPKLSSTTTHIVSQVCTQRPTSHRHTTKKINKCNFKNTYFFFTQRKLLCP